MLCHSKSFKQHLHGVVGAPYTLALSSSGCMCLVHVMHAPVSFLSAAVTAQPGLTGLDITVDANKGCER